MMLMLKEGTIISVNATYMVRAHYTGTSTTYDMFGVRVATHALHPRTATFSVSSTSPTLDQDNWTCASRGTLEREILDMVGQINRR